MNDKRDELLRVLADDLNTNITIHNLCRKWGVQIVEAEPDEDGWTWTDRVATIQRLAQHALAEDGEN